ncbi:MAG: sugar phosphate isomerase/epimerase [Clostridia bacterium]|nr:sugar phosphate isomerase/epimerase [Clostridia bacterium]
MMKLGMINNYPTKESLEYVKGLGLSFIEICNNDNDESVNFHKNVAKYAADCKEAGLSFGSIGRWNSEMNVGGKINEAEFEIVATNLRDAIEYNCPTFVCGCNYDDSISLFKNYSAAIEIFGRLLDIAKGSNTKVATYNCDWNNFVNNMDVWKVTHTELPDLMIKFDASHSYHAGRDYLREVSDWGDRFAHIHIKGAVNTNGRFVDDPPAGMDDLKWPSIFAALYSRGYDGCLSLEPHSDAWAFDTERGKAGVRFTVDYIKNYIM